MKKDQLLELGIDEETAGKILELHKEELSAVEQERDKFSGELSTEKAERAREKETLEKNLHEIKYAHAADKFLSNYKFTSELAKEAATTKLLAKALNLAEDGTLEGADDFIKELQKNQPTAFVVDEKKPKIIGGSSGGGTKITQEEYDKMSYNERLKFFRENPEDYKVLSGQGKKEE